MSALQLHNTNTQTTSWDSNGEGYISQTAVAKLLGMPRKTFSDNLQVFKDTAATLKLNEINQIHEDSLFDVVEFMANKPNAKVQAQTFFTKIKKLGARTTIIGVSGVSPPSANQEVTSFQQLRLIADLMESVHNQEQELLVLGETKADNSRVDDLEKVVRGSQCPHGYLPKARLALLLDVPVNTAFSSLLAKVRYVKYPYSAGTNNAIQPREATAYHIEDTRASLEL